MRIETPSGELGEMSGPRLRERLEALAKISDEAGALTRLYLSPAHRRAADLVRQWMEEAGMTSFIDGAGTVVGRYDGETSQSPTLLLGSHIDTVRDAGCFDGTLGVAIAIAVVSRFAEAGLRLPFALEVLAFGDEEGVRFPTTLTGSRALAGTLGSDALGARDADGITVREALTAFGCDPEDIPPAARDPRRVLGYLELHIEQGTRLEAEDLPVGLVSGISGAMRLSIEVEGTSGHAGTLAMDRRSDALCGAAEMVLAIEARARALGDLLATVGCIRVRSGAVNVVPGAATFTLDVRAFDDELRRSTLEAMLADAGDIAFRRGLRLRHRIEYDQATTRCDTRLLGFFSTAMERRRLRPISLASGAGHDGLAVAALCPIAMLFVRCRGGISHHPAEEVANADMETAAVVLVDAIFEYASEHAANQKIQVNTSL